jgi:hypothetical protein
MSDPLTLLRPATRAEREQVMARFLTALHEIAAGIQARPSGATCRTRSTPSRRWRWSSESWTRPR